MPTVAEQSFALFVYPFLFDAGQFEERASAFDDACWGEENVWLPGLPQEVHLNEEMPAYVADYINPPPKVHATARLWRLSNALDKVLGLARRADWHLVLYSDNDKRRKAIPFRWGEGRENEAAAKLMLFRGGVGLLSVYVKPKTDSLAAWQDFVYHFRFVKGQRNSCRVRGERRTGYDRQTNQPVTEPFFPEPAGGLAAHPEGLGVFDDLMRALLLTGARGGAQQQEWWREVFIPEQAIPYVVLYVDGQPEAERPRLIHSLRNFFRPTTQTRPSPSDLSYDHASLLPYADHIWFTFTLDGSSFLAFDAPETEFFRQNLPVNLRYKYFLLFLLVLHQRFTLMKLSQQVSEKWLQGDEESRARSFEQLQQALFEFTARGYFVQVMQSEHYHPYYRKLQETFQIAELYREVRDEVQDMYEHLQTRRTERLQQLAEESERQARTQRLLEEKRERAAQKRVRDLEERLSFIGILIGVPALTLSFLGINLKQFTTSNEGLWAWQALLIAFGGGLLGVLVLWLLRRGAQRRRNG